MNNDIVTILISAVGITAGILVLIFGFIENRKDKEEIERAKERAKRCDVIKLKRKL